MLKRRCKFIIKKELLVLFIKIIIEEKPSGSYKCKTKSCQAYRGTFNSTVTFTVGENSDRFFIYLPFSKKNLVDK